MTVHLLATGDPLAPLLPSEVAQLARPVGSVAEAALGPARMEAKLDGWRMLAHVAEDGVRLYARSGARCDGKLPEIEQELAARFPVGTWLDGEAVAMRVEDGRVVNEWGLAQTTLSRNALSPTRHALTYMVFDLLAHGGHDARPLPFRNRRHLLDQIFAKGDFDRIALTVTCEPTQANHERLVALGFEGTMVKLLGSPYASGRRGNAWSKVKPQTSIEAIVMGFKPGRNGFTGLVGAVYFGQYDATGELVERGKCSGFDMHTRRDMTDNPDKWLGTVIEVRHMGVSIGAGDSGRFRHPQFSRPRPDRDPASVTLHDR